MAYTLRTSSAHKQAILAPMEIWCTWKKWNAFTLSTCRERGKMSTLMMSYLQLSRFLDFEIARIVATQFFKQSEEFGMLDNHLHLLFGRAVTMTDHSNHTAQLQATGRRGGRQMQNGRQETARLAEQQNFNAGRQATLCTSTAAKMRKNLDLRRT